MGANGLKEVSMDGSAGSKGVMYHFADKVQGAETVGIEGKV